MMTALRLIARSLLLAAMIAPKAVAVDLAVMPRSGDYTSMWWEGGFPGVVPGAPWRRCVLTGHYAMVLDTESLQIAHLGAVPPGIRYRDCGAGEAAAWQDLPGAGLSLKIAVNGVDYECVGGGRWGRFRGPRTIVSGRLLQRADVTDLVFQSAEGERLNVEARLESVAWPERLGLILSAEPGLEAIRAGEASFGRIGGGFGLDGSNDLVIPHEAALDSEEFSLELWVYVPLDYRVSERTWPWLVCKNRNEHADGNFGIMLVNGRAQARMNIGGGAQNQVVVESRALGIGKWNHLAMTYDGESLRLFLDGRQSGEERVGRRRKPGRDPLVFGRRADGSGDGYRFRGVIDEIRIDARALSPEEVLRRFRTPGAEPAPDREWGFRADGEASETLRRVRWENPVMAIALTQQGKTLRRSGGGGQVSLSIDPVKFEEFDDSAAGVKVEARGRAVALDSRLGCYRISLDGLEPIVPDGDPERMNDAIERLNFSLSNSSDKEAVLRLMFEKTARGFRQRIGSPITGMSAILRDKDGYPTGIPVQLSKNWHSEPEGGVYVGTWFHGISQLRLPPKSELDLELVLAYGHWGGVAAASHAQLSLIGWGTNQRWDESALGSWGESICYEPEQIQGKCSITDVRPVMVTPMNGKGKWSWTNNVGGGDFFRFFDVGGERVAHSAMRASYQRHGPCLTEVTYSGKLGEWGTHSEVVSLARTDDLVRGCYRLRLDVRRDTEFSRFVIFQVGADTYNQTREKKIALGSEIGLIQEWETGAGAEGYRGEAYECQGRIPWISLHEGAPYRESDRSGAWANRGIIIRSWEARLGGESASPWLAEHGTNSRGGNTATVDLVPPPGVKQLKAGDFVEAVIEYIVMPKSADDYYGPNDDLRVGLLAGGNTWRMIQREALGNDRRVKVSQGTLEATRPSVRVKADGNGRAAFTLDGGLGYVPITISGLRSHRRHELRVDGEVLDQGVHGNDYWQCDFDPDARSWSLTFNVPMRAEQPREIEFAPRR